jgi:hypothetical protein
MQKWQGGLDEGAFVKSKKKSEEIEELAHEISKRSKGQSGRELRLLADVPQPLLVAAGRRTSDGRSLARREQVRPGPRDALTD